MSIFAEILDESGNAINFVEVGQVTDGINALDSILIKNSGTETLTNLYFGVLLGNRTTSGENYEGQECYDEKWVEAKLSTAGSYTAIGNGTYLILTPPGIGATIQIDLRLNIPTVTASLGNISIYLEAFYG